MPHTPNTKPEAQLCDEDISTMTTKEFLTFDLRELYIYYVAIWGDPQANQQYHIDLLHTHALSTVGEAIETSVESTFNNLLSEFKVDKIDVDTIYESTVKEFLTSKTCFTFPLFIPCNFFGNIFLAKEHIEQMVNLEIKQSEFEGAVNLVRYCSRTQYERNKKYYVDFDFEEIKSIYMSSDGIIDTQTQELLARQLTLIRLWPMFIIWCSKNEQLFQVALKQWEYCNWKKIVELDEVWLQKTLWNVHITTFLSHVARQLQFFKDHPDVPQQELPDAEMQNETAFVSNGRIEIRPVRMIFDCIKNSGIADVDDKTICRFFGFENVKSYRSARAEDKITYSRKLADFAVEILKCFGPDQQDEIATRAKIGIKHSKS